MQYGWIPVAAASPEIKVAECRHNASAAARLMQEAYEQGARVLVLSELCLTGATCGDLFLQQKLLDGALDALRNLVGKSRANPLLCVVSLPLAAHGRLYNCAAIIYRGALLGLVPKTCLSHAQRRYFTPAPAANGSIDFDGQAVAFGPRLLFRCRELPDFTLAVEMGEDLSMPFAPSARHAQAGATIIANPSASYELIGRDDYRRLMIRSQSSRLTCGYIRAEAGRGESSTDFVFSGHCLIAEDGDLIAENQAFEDGFTYTQIDVSRLSGARRAASGFLPDTDGYAINGYSVIDFSMPLTQTKLTRPIATYPFVPNAETERALRCERILAMQANALATRLDSVKAKRVVLGISGGLDSSLALLAATRAFDTSSRARSDIIAVTMPCFGTTERTRANAEALCDCLGVTLRCVDISEAVRGHFRDIGHDEADQNVTFENAQARERTQVLMDIANDVGGLVVGTGDLSELALGWSTYNGDHMSMYGINASVPKTLVRHIVHHAALTSDDERLCDTLLDILDTPVSPELLPAKGGHIQQKTEDIVGPYDLHDFFLYYAVRRAFAPKKIWALALYAFDGIYDRQTIHRWLRVFYSRFFAQQFKRSCLPDGPKIGTVSLSPRGDWVMPSDANARLWLDEVDAQYRD